MLPYSHPSVIRLRQSLGMEGYGIYVALSGIIEQGGNIPIPIDPDAFAYDFHCEASKVMAVISDFALFYLVGDGTFANTKPRSVAQSESRSLRAKKAAAARWGKTPPSDITPVSAASPADDNQLSLFTPPIESPPPAEQEPATVLGSSAADQPSAPPTGKKKPPDPAFTPCREAFESLYSQYHHGDQFYWQAKDSKALKQLLAQIRFMMPEADRSDPQKLIYNYTHFIECCINSGDAFLQQHIDNCYISSHFNDIYNLLKNGKPKQSASIEQRELTRQRNLDYISSYLRTHPDDGTI